jgi:hypothetical protein
MPAEACVAAELATAADGTQAVRCKRPDSAGLVGAGAGRHVPAQDSPDEVRRPVAGLTDLVMFCPLSHPASFQPYSFLTPVLNPTCRRRSASLDPERSLYAAANAAAAPPAGEAEGIVPVLATLSNTHEVDRARARHIVKQYSRSSFVYYTSRSLGPAGGAFCNQASCR